MTDGRLLAHTGEVQQATGMCWQQVAGHWGMQVTVGRSRCVPLSGGRPLAYTGDSQHAAGMHWRQVAGYRITQVIVGRQLVHVSDRWQAASACQL